ncbi:ATP-dependent DNA helicase sgs1, partial [Mortierella sp. AD032]
CTFKPDILSDLADGKFRAIFLTPEIIFESERLKPLWFKPSWQHRLQAIVLDEAHCVATWGTTFRTSYNRIGELRSKVPRGVVFIAVSATLPPMALYDLKERVHFNQATTIINVGNDRPNVRLEVRSIYLRDKYSHLDFLMDFKKTIVYFESRKETIAAASYLEGLTLKTAAEGRIHSSHINKIATYHALYSDNVLDEQVATHSFKLSEFYLQKNILPNLLIPTNTSANSSLPRNVAGKSSMNCIATSISPTGIVATFASQSQRRSYTARQNCSH